MSTHSSLLLQSGLEGVRATPSVLWNAVIVLLGAYAVARLASAVLSSLAERSPRRRITIKMFIPIVVFVVYGTASYLVLGPLLRLSTTQLFAVSGLLGAALGFGLKDLFAGVIGGLVIITEKPYQVGDKISIDGDYGEVVSIDLRSTTLQTPDDNAVRVPNAALFTSHISNANDGNSEMLVVVEVAIASDANLDTATSIVEDALVTSPYVVVDEDHPFTVLVDDESFYRTVRGKAYVADLRDEFAFASDVTERSLVAFEEKAVPTPELSVEPHTDGRGHQT